MCLSCRYVCAPCICPVPADVRKGHKFSGVLKQNWELYKTNKYS